MKISIALIAVMAQVASATFGHLPKPPVPAPAPVCGTTTITEQCKTATKLVTSIKVRRAELINRTSYSHFPTVTETITK